MNIDDKKKMIAWRLAKASFTSCSIFLSGFNDPALSAVDVSKSLVDALEKFGCLDEKYGDDGSYEVDMAVKAMSSIGFVDCCCKSVNLNSIVPEIFRSVRELIALGVCGDEIERMRTVEYDREQSEIQRRHDAEAERLRKEREAEVEAKRREKLDRIAKLESEIASKEEV